MDSFVREGTYLGARTCAREALRFE
jgi:hypothetical protein